MINPVITRHARTLFRFEKTRPAVALAFYLVVLVLAFFLNYVFDPLSSVSWEHRKAAQAAPVAEDAGLETSHAEKQAARSTWKDTLRSYWYLLVAIQVFALIVVGGVRVAGSVVKEREHKRFDFIVITGMSPWRIAEGEMFGSALFCYFLVLCTLPFSALCVLGGGVSWELFGYSYLILFSGAFFFHSWSLLVSSVSRSYAGATVAALIFMGLFSAAVMLEHFKVPMFGDLAMLSPFYLSFAAPRTAGELGHIGFFTREFPMLFAVAVVYVFFGYWALNAASRKIRGADRTYISKLQAVVFTALFCTAASGLLAARGPEIATQLSSFLDALFFETAIYLSLALLLLVVFAFLLSPSASSYRNLKEGRPRGVLYALFGEKSLFFLNLLILFAVVVAVYFAVLVPMFTKVAQHPLSLTATRDGRPPLADIGFGFCLVLFIAIFYSIVVQLLAFSSKRVGRELAALILLFLVMLPILAEGFQPGGLTEEMSRGGFMPVFNPVAVLTTIFPVSGGIAAEGARDSLAFTSLLTYFIACVLLAALFYARVRSMFPQTQPASVETPPVAGAESAS